MNHRLEFTGCFLTPITGTKGLHRSDPGAFSPSFNRRLCSQTMSVGLERKGRDQKKKITIKWDINRSRDLDRFCDYAIACQMEGGGVTRMSWCVFAGVLMRA